MNEADEATRCVKGSDCRGIAGFRDQVEANGHYADVVIFPDRALKLYALLEVFD